MNDPVYQEIVACKDVMGINWIYYSTNLIFLIMAGASASIVYILFKLDMKKCVHRNIFIQFFISITWTLGFWAIYYNSCPHYGKGFISMFPTFISLLVLAIKMWSYGSKNLEL